MAINNLFDRKEDCFGCGACENICPRNAIKMLSDEQGFLYPQIDENLCVSCGLCKKVCQIGKQSELVNEIAEGCFGIKNTDEIRKVSSSGGVYTAISNVLINGGGYA